MSAKEHFDYNNEQEYLQTTLECLKNYNEYVLKENTRINEAVYYAITHFNSDNAEQFNELLINTSLQETTKKKIFNLSKSLKTPYFARVDFSEGPSNSPSKYYIGKMSLHDDTSDKDLIYDWRAPVANLYYEGRLGDASYTCLDGNISGEITLKRQYSILEGELKEIFDIDITTNDDFLQAALAGRKDNRLKDIVSTIQAEQNKIIRANMWRPLIVQGAAGGGKTTIALHRIAYLIYNHEDTLKPSNFMIMAPNRFFLSYISEVLPELGVENVSQNTFEEFCFKILDKSFQLEYPHEKLSNILNLHKNNQLKEKEFVLKSSHLKSSLLFKTMVEYFIKDLSKSIIPKEDFYIHTTVLFSYEELNKQFLKDYAYLPLYKRIEEIKKSLINKVNYNKKSILENIVRDYDKKLDIIRTKMKDSPERREKITLLIEEREALLKKVKNNFKSLIKDYISKIQWKSPLEYYIDFISSIEKFNINNTDLNLLNYIKSYSLKNLLNNSLEFEDLSPLVYIKYLIYGLDKNLPIKHIIIDEAQDFSLFQFFILKKLINSNSFTILGDLCQGIYSYRGVNNWNDVKNLIFKDEDVNYLTLEQSYRSTIEIIEASNKIIEVLNYDSHGKPGNLYNKAVPVLRHGQTVVKSKKTSLEEVCASIKLDLIKGKEKNYSSIGIVCNSLEECTVIKKLLNDNNINLISGKEKDFSSGVLIIPSYLSKGLEFDMVILPSFPEKFNKLTKLELKLIYVSMTRALHELILYSYSH